MAEASNSVSEVRWDGRGPYRVVLMGLPGYPAGTKMYVAPNEAAMGHHGDARLKAWGTQMLASKPGKSFNHMSADSSFFDGHTGSWDQKFDPTGLGIVGAGGIIGAGVAGAGAGAGGGTSASAAPGAVDAAGVVGPAGGGVPLGGVGATTGATSAAGGTLGKLAGWLKDHGGDLAALGIPAAAMAFGGNGGGGNSALSPEISRLLAQAEARTRRADPLHQAAVQMAFGALPTYGRAGINLPKVDLP